MNLLIFGPPGSGKGTQSVRLSNLYNLFMLDTGNILRSSEFYNRVSDSMDKGILLSDDIVIDVVINKILKFSSGFILDGFPRSVKQAKALFVDYNRDIKIDYIFILHVEKSLILDRLLHRKICSNCGSTTCDKKSICAVCSSSNFIRRNDDNEEVIRNRIAQYDNNYRSILPYFSSNEVINIDGNNHPDIVFQEICTYLSKET
ncbi:AAA family ATPase [Anaplasmataceae bacterium AB001_6]|nr:AAA family ATPase [Anaplasmataceae bacterium AB001_6]